MKKYPPATPPAKGYKYGTRTKRRSELQLRFTCKSKAGLVDNVLFFWPHSGGSSREERGCSSNSGADFYTSLRMIGIWLWRHHTFPESSPAYPHIQTASVGDESQCSLHSFFFYLFFFSSSLFCRFFPEYLFFALLTQSRHWALLLRNGLVPPSVVRQGWSIGLLVSCVYLHDQPVKIDHLFCQCSYNHSDLETSRRERARVGCTFFQEHGTSTTHSLPPSPYIPHSGQTRQSPPHPLRSRMCIPSFAR